MRLARLAAVGLAIGVIAGFAIALLRPRPNTPAITLTGTPETPGDVASTASTGSAAEDQLWDQFRKADRSPVVELRSHRRVNG